MVQPRAISRSFYTYTNSGGYTHCFVGQSTDESTFRKTTNHLHNKLIQTL